MLCMLFLLLQVSGWCCLEVKVHGQVEHEPVYVYHLRTVPPCSPLAVTFSYCCTAGWRAIVLRLQYCWQLRSNARTRTLQQGCMCM